jgi:hypothetical protein
MAAQSEKDAVKKVDKHVSPKECFIWYIDNKRGYEPIPGTGCAHFCTRSHCVKSSARHRVAPTVSLAARRICGGRRRQRRAAGMCRARNWN